MRDLTKPRGWKSRLSAIVLSIVIAMAFMPSLGAVNQAKAYEGEWSIYGDPETIYITNGEKVQLDVILDYDVVSEEPTIKEYRWYLADEDGFYSDYPDCTSSEPEHIIDEVWQSQRWKCEAISLDGEKRECYFDVCVESSWYIEDVDGFFYHVEEGQDIELDPDLEIVYREGYNSSDFIFTYEWCVYKSDEESGDWNDVPIDGANQKKYVAKNVTEDVTYILKVHDQYGNCESAIVDVSVISADQKKADGVTEAIDNIKEIADITLADKAGIMAAKAAYDALSLDQKNLLYTSDINKLMEAIKKIEALEAEAKKKAEEEAKKIAEAVAKAKAEAEAKAKAEAEAKAKAEAEAKAKAEAEAKAKAEAEAKAKAEAEAKAKAEAKKKAEKKAIAKAKKLTVKDFKVKANKGKKVTATWKVTKGAKGYQIMYSLNKKFKKAKKVNIKKAKAKKTVIKKLKAKKNYFVKIRPYSVVKKANGKKVTVYGKWSKVKKVKAKK